MNKKIICLLLFFVGVLNYAETTNKYPLIFVHGIAAGFEKLLGDIQIEERTLADWPDFGAENKTAFIAPTYWYFTHIV